MDENKSQIVAAFLPVLQQTRAGSNVASLDYVKHESDEAIIITYSDGNKSSVNVSMDSGAAVLYDILRHMK